MAHNNKNPSREQHHFLYHIFRLDKAKNPMPQNRANALFSYLKKLFNDNKEQ